MLQYLIDQQAYKLVENGYLAIFKRKSITSAQELNLFKAAISTAVKASEMTFAHKKMHRLKVGHGGTLDKMASGVLAVGLCKGCKVLPLFLKSDKQYRVTACMGVATDSYDADGRIIENCLYEHVTKDMIEDKLQNFIGEIQQKPPVYSALKRGGKRVSDIARDNLSSPNGKKNEAIEMKARPVKCYDVQCTDFNPPYFTLEIKCGSGFYVRSLINDLTRELGSCGYVTDLLRTKHGPFELDDCLYIEDYKMANVVTAVRRNQRRFPLYADASKTSEDV